MTLSDQITGFMSAPLDPDGDGKTSLVEWIAFLGLAAVIALAWKRVLNLMFSESE
jgi:hypothetical protein